MQTLKLITWNVRGFHTTSKRIKVINHLVKLRADICFLQETHLTDTELQHLHFKQFDKIFSSTFNSKQRGVSILINKKINFTLNSSTADPDGRFIIINISINHLTFTLANIYAPNNDDPLFFHNLFSLLYNSTNLIVAGDFNTALNPSLEGTHKHNTRTCYSSEVIKQYMTDYGLGDSGRARNPLLREYSYASSAHHSCRYIPIWHNPDFCLHREPINFPKWQQNGITHLHHIFENHKFMPFTSIIQKFGIGRDQFLHYQQLKSLINSKITLTNTLQPSQTSEQLLKIANHPTKLISKLYRLIASSSPTITLPKKKWEGDLTIPPDPDFWTQICRNTFNMTTNTNLQLIQYKTIHRTHITQSKLFKMGLSDTDTCSQCTSGNTDTYLHATWLCQPGHSLWTTLTNTLSSVLDCRVPLSPALCLL